MLIGMIALSVRFEHLVLILMPRWYVVARLGLIAVTSNDPS